MALGTTLWATGTSTSVAAIFPINGCPVGDPLSALCHQIGMAYLQPTFTIGIVEVVVGVALVAGALTLAIVAVRQARLTIRVPALEQKADA